MPITDLEGEFPEMALAKTKAVLTALSLPELFPCICRLIQHLQSAHDAFGGIYIHPADDLYQELLLIQAKVSHQPVEDKRTAIIHHLVWNSSIGIINAGALNPATNLKVRWLPQDESFAAFKQKHGEQTRLYALYDEAHLLALEQWLLDLTAVRH